MNLKDFFRQLAITTSTVAIEKLLTSDDSPFVKRPSPPPKVARKQPRVVKQKKSDS